ncbi:MAG: hypothetical protein ACKVPY_14570 [Paracoccaceae bacterium]
MSARRRALALALLALMPSAALGEAPLSAIDWLSRSVAEPVRPASLPVPAIGAPAGAGIDVTALSRPTLDGIGLLSAARSGLPRDLWGPTTAAEAVRLIRAERIDTLPAIQSLLYLLLLAETEPPAGADPANAVFLARVDKLLDLGAVDPALALLELPERLAPETFRRRFDAALLLGAEDKACAAMRDNPQIAPSFPARIFCLARGGDWDAAALSLQTGRALGFIGDADAALLERFLDPDIAESEPELALPERPSPLTFRMLEATGQPMTTATLPLAFAQSDLRSNSGWKTRIEAAERLARTGAIEPNLLLGLYTEQEPAASGGTWDRVAAIRSLDAAVTANDVRAVAAALPIAWEAMAGMELEVPLAEIYGEKLAAVPLSPEASALAFRIGLLSASFGRVAAGRIPADPGEAFLIGLAQGRASDLPPPGELAVAVNLAFSDKGSDDPDLARLLAEGRTGEAILRAIDNVTDGAKGDLRDVTAGLRLLRTAGLNTFARRAALELLLLERRG